MRLGNYFAAVAAASLAAAPALAAPANSAASLSVSKSVRTGSPSVKSNKFGGTGAVIAVLAVLAVAGGIVAATSGSSKPKSP